MAKMRAGSRMSRSQEILQGRPRKWRALMSCTKGKINRWRLSADGGTDPVFISFYRVLLEEAWKAPDAFCSGSMDLSSKIHIRVPLLMAAHVRAFKLNPAPPDPMQAKIMQFIAAGLTGMMAWFPSDWCFTG